LIFAVVFKLFQLIGRTSSSALTIAFLSAAIWTIHPLHTSTALYVIQRMTELVAFFTLIGIWCYLQGRKKLISAPGPAYLWMSGGIIAFGVLALLSKENGVLLPLYILIIEFTLFRQLPRPDHWRYWAAPMLILPSLLLLAYLGYSIDGHTSKFANRDFSLYERILSEPRALFDYLWKIIFPVHTPSLYFDDFQKSTALLSPITTLLSSFALLAGLIASLVFSKRYPIISFAVLWFLGGHILESSVLPLELYFEHRNYLPMLGIIIAAAYYAEKLVRLNSKVFIGGATVLISTLAIITWQHSNTWSDNTKLIALLAEKQPDSARAQINHTVETFKAVGGNQAMKQLIKTKEHFPDSLGIAILHTDVICQNNQLTKDIYLQLIEQAKTLRIDPYTNNSISQLVNNVHEKNCKQVTDNGLLALTNAILKNKATPENKNRQVALQLIKAKIFTHKNELEPALKALDEAFRYQPSIDLALNQARLLAGAGLLEPAKTQLNKAEAIDKLRSRLRPSRQAEIEEVRLFIESKNNH
jgi:tetratricopeptide (TPR) repeat protein